MKKTTVKRIITGILAVTTIASSALLFAGCGEKSPEEKAKDALNDFASEAMNDLNALSPKEETQKETVELNLMDKIISDKLYTVKYNADKNHNGFYVHLNDAIDVDGYTVELREKKDEYNYYPNTIWDIKKSGEKLAWFVMTRDTRAATEIKGNKMIVTIGAGDLISEDNSEVDFKFTEKSRENIEIDVPAALTQDECKQHMDELKATASDVFKNDYMSDSYKTPKLDGVYYFPGDIANAQVYFVYSVNYYNQDCVVYVELERPFILDGKMDFFNTDLKFIGTKSDIEHGYATQAIDFSQATRIG